MNIQKLLLGILAGVAGGALAGILFAPEKGSKTRKRISRKGEKYSDDVKDKFEEFYDKVNTKFDDVKDHVTKFAEQTKAKHHENDKIAK